MARTATLGSAARRRTAAMPPALDTSQGRAVRVASKAPTARKRHLLRHQCQRATTCPTFSHRIWERSDVRHPFILAGKQTFRPPNPPARLSRSNRRRKRRCRRSGQWRGLPTKRCRKPLRSEAAPASPSTLCDCIEPPRRYPSRRPERSASPDRWPTHIYLCHLLLLREPSRHESASYDAGRTGHPPHKFSYPSRLQLY